MIRTKIILALIIASFSIFAQNKDSEAIIDAAVKKGYIGAYINADSLAMRKSLHPKLEKVKVDSLTGAYFVTADFLVSNTGPQKTTSFEELDVKYEVLDVSDNIGAIKVTNKNFWDLIYLTKWNQDWLITNVVWHTWELENYGSQEELVTSIQNYTKAFYSGDKENTAEYLYPKVGMIKPVSRDSVVRADFNTILKYSDAGKDAYNNVNISEIEIKILSILSSYASVKVIYDDKVEFQHWRYIDSNWYLVNGLWDK